MKKFIVCILAVSTIFTLTACKNKNKKNGAGNSDIPKNSTTTSTDSILLATDTSNITTTTTDEKQLPVITTSNTVASVVTTAPVVIAPTIGSLTPEQISGLSNEKIGYGSGINVDADNRPTGATMMQNDYGEYNAYFINPKDSCIYLTFDEGYENGYTSVILDTLKEKNVSATFFVTYSYVKSNPDLIKRMVNEGHVVGNHSWTHPSMPDLDAAGVASEITQLHNYVKDNFGYEMSLFRPPMGEFSERTLAITQSLGYKSAFWSFAYADWDVNDQPNSKEAFDRITSSSHGGAIYLLHAVSETNTQILGSVIDYWRNSGYTVTAMK